MLFKNLSVASCRHSLSFTLSEISRAPSHPLKITQPSTGSEACCLYWAYCTTIQRKRENLGKLKTRENLRVEERKRRYIREKNAIMMMLMGDFGFHIIASVHTRFALAVVYCSVVYCVEQKRVDIVAHCKASSSSFVGWFLSWSDHSWKADG